MQRINQCAHELRTMQREAETDLGRCDPKQTAGNAKRNGEVVMRPHQLIVVIPRINPHRVEKEEQRYDGVEDVDPGRGNAPPWIAPAQHHEMISCVKLIPRSEALPHVLSLRC
jgi:hypothetical protein